MHTCTCSEVILKKKLALGALLCMNINIHATPYELEFIDKLSSCYSHIRMLDVSYLCILELYVSYFHDLTQS